MRRRVMLIVMDGWGVSPHREGNAIELGRTPFWHGLLDRHPHTTLTASGEAVGLRKGLMGNSEVGHMTLGAGRVIWQDITRIDRSIDGGGLSALAPLREAADRVRKNGGALHLIGLVSDGGVHSDAKHYLALLDWASAEKIPVRIHVLTDGRDTPPKSGIDHVRHLSQHLAMKGDASIASLMGRYWGMDRDQRWDRTSRAYEAMVRGRGREAVDPVEAVRHSYEQGETDEFIQPWIFPGRRIENGDSVIFFNFRADRMRQIVSALAFDTFEGFERQRRPLVYVVTMTGYREDWTLPVLFPREEHTDTLGGVVADRGMKQLRLAETEKYAHVTFFFNAGSDAPLRGEERILVPSPKVATYDLQPEMSAVPVTEKSIEALRSDRFDMIVQNFANPDMVAHSGVLPATIRACEVIDECLGRIVPVALERGWEVLITGDHGNCEQMIDVDGQPHTYHTTNPVPLVLIGNDVAGVRLRSGGSFRDVAPTILTRLGVPVPRGMEGTSLAGS